MKRISCTPIILALFLLLFLSQCYYDEILIEEPEPPAGEISFLGNIIPIFNADCNTSGCHNTAGIAPDLTPANAYNSLISGNYINTEVPEDSELYQWMAGNRSLSMPIDGPNSTYNVTVLEWIKQGAKNN